ncbi:MAG: hypothetical protein ABEJ87_01950 [Candidatus Nanohalobium sp.]
MNKTTHAVIAVILISSTAAIQVIAQPEHKKPVNGTIPTYQGIKTYRQNHTVVLDSMTDRQKIALMIDTYRYEKMPRNRIIGGIHLQSAPSRKAFKERIEKFKSGRKIKPLITVDLEGCIEATGKFKDFKS